MPLARPQRAPCREDTGGDRFRDRVDVAVLPDGIVAAHVYDHIAAAFLSVRGARLARGQHPLALMEQIQGCLLYTSRCV